MFCERCGEMFLSVRYNQISYEHDKKRLRQAKDDWINKKFPKVPEDETYIPFPGDRK